AGQAFAAEKPVSDHLPQKFQVVRGSETSPTHAAAADHEPPLLEILSWNVMCRGRAGQTGRQGTALQGQTLTNNGLDCNETMEEYEQRLLERVVPVLGDWFGSSRGSSQTSGCQRGPRVACLQEFPAMPVLQEEIQSRLRRLAGPTAQLAVGPLPGPGDKSSSCLALIWDSANWLSSSLSASQEGPACLRAHLQAGGSFCSVELASVHLPFVDVPTGPQAGIARDIARQWLSRQFPPDQEGGEKLRVVCGDFNVDIREVRALPAVSWACVADSSKFRAADLTMDACAISDSFLPLPGAEGGAAVVIEGQQQQQRQQQQQKQQQQQQQQQQEQQQQKQQEQQKQQKQRQRPQQQSTGVLRPGDPSGTLSIFGIGGGRDEFLASRVHRDLQDDPRLWRLGDKELATLGCWPFAEQARVLTRLLQSSKRNNQSVEDGGPAKRNPLAAALGVASSSDSSEEEEDGEE
ncbi:unnamed protein product, partial [Polarella glacialis]